MEGKMHIVSAFFQHRRPWIQSVSVHCWERVHRGFIEGSLRVHWGLGGVNLNEPSMNPQYTPFGMSLYIEWMELESGKCPPGMNCKYINRDISVRNGSTGKWQIHASQSLTSKSDTILYFQFINPIHRTYKYLLSTWQKKRILTKYIYIEQLTK